MVISTARTVALAIYIALGDTFAVQPYQEQNSKYCFFFGMVLYMVTDLNKDMAMAIGSSHLEIG